MDVFQRGFAASESIQVCVPELFISGVRVDDMDRLEHFEAFIATTLPILIVTPHADGRTFSILQELRYDGVDHAPVEGVENMPTAPRWVMEHRSYRR